MRVTAKFGLTSSITKEFARGTSFRSIVNNSSVKSALGHGDNVQVVVDGVPQRLDYEASDGDVIVLETLVSEKALAH